jgi:hypothetical protein
VLLCPYSSSPACCNHPTIKWYLKCVFVNDVGVVTNIVMFDLQASLDWMWPLKTSIWHA